MAEAETKNAIRSALKRSRREVENDEFAAFSRRILRAFGRRVGNGDVDALADLLALQGELQAVIEQGVQGLRAEGFSWSEIAQRAGVRTQTAWERWGKKGVA